MFSESGTITAHKVLKDADFKPFFRDIEENLNRFVVLRPGMDAAENVTAASEEDLVKMMQKESREYFRREGANLQQQQQQGQSIAREN